MSKNMTRKGLALGAVVALAITGFTALPASANGINDGSVSLLPNSGAEYDIIAGAAFELKSNMATGVTQSGRYLKFLVQDANRDISVASGQYSVSGAAHGSVTVSGNTVTIPIANHLFKIGDVVEISGYTASPAINGARTVTAIVAGGSGSITFDLGVAAGAPSASSSPTVKVAAETNRAANGSFVVDTKVATNTDDKVVRLRSMDKNATQTAVVTAWVDSNDNGSIDPTEYASPARTVNFLASTAITPSVRFVPAYVDQPSVTAEVTFSPVLNGAQLTSSFNLVSAAAAVQVEFTRPGSAQTLRATQVSYSNTTKVFTAVSPSFGPANASAAVAVNQGGSAAEQATITITGEWVPGDTITVANVATASVVYTVAASDIRATAAETHAAIRAGLLTAITSAAGATYNNNSSGTNVVRLVIASGTANVTDVTATVTSPRWSISQPVDRTLTSVSITSNVVTATVNGAHGLQVGDRVVITNATTTRANSPTSGLTQYSRVTSVPTTTTFTYAELNADSTAATGANLAATAQSAGDVDVDTDSDTKIVRNLVVVGQYTTQARLFRYDVTLTDELTRIGTLGSATVGATSAASAAFAGVPGANSNLAGQVRVGTTSTSAVLTVLDIDGNPVGAGVNVAMTAVRHSGTSVVTVNGISVGASVVSLSGVTDASGKVTVAITNATGAAGDVVRLTADAQGSLTSNFDVTWQNATYSIVDLKDQSTISSPARNRAAEANGTYAFDLLVIDQFKSPAPATVRLLATVTGRTTSTTPVALTNGRATVNIVPDGSAVTGNTTVVMEFQTQDTSTGLWSKVGNGSLDARYVDWGTTSSAPGAGTSERSAVTINFYNQTDRVTLNANGANLPSSTAAVRTANVTTKALKAVDLRTANDTNETYPTTARAIVSGSVTNSVTGVAKAGGVVTISGTGLLFKVGDVWALNTLTFIAEDGTFAVDVYSRVSGQQTVTVASGSVTSTAVLTFNAVGGAGATGLTVNLITPETASPGTTFQVQGQVRDANGNPIVISTAGTGATPTLTVTYNGPGLVSGALPTTTNASGTFSFFVLLGSNDRGTASVTATYDADGTGTAVAAISSTRSVTVGPVEPIIGSFNGRVAVRVENAKGSEITVKIGRATYKFTATSNNQLRSWKSRKGASVKVDVLIDGELENSKTITVK